MLSLDGVYVERPDGSLRFRWVKAPTRAELTAFGGPRLHAGLAVTGAAVIKAVIKGSEFLISVSD